MSSQQWIYRAGELARGGWDTVVDDSMDGWQHGGIRVGTVAGGSSMNLEANDLERVVIPLSGSFIVKHWSGYDTQVSKLQGRSNVFEGATDVLYVGAESAIEIAGEGRFAVAEARARAPLASRYIRRDEVPIEIRGAGQSSRQVHNFGTPAVLDADRLIVCEVITPAGNWSSYPAHKHDEAVPGRETRLEEIYYFEAAVSRGLTAPAAAEPFGLFSTTSSSAGLIEMQGHVRPGDVALVPFGYHGPAVAAPGYDLYYLNVMAGPDAERAWNISDHPAHQWVRSTWAEQEPDPRLPYRSPSEGFR